jgi:hypothetical protein
MSCRSYKYRCVIMYSGGRGFARPIISDSIQHARSDAKYLAKKYSNGRKVIMVNVVRWRDIKE